MKTTAILFAALGVIGQVASAPFYQDGKISCYDNKWTVDGAKPKHFSEITRAFCNQHAGQMLEPFQTAQQTITVQTAEGKPWNVQLYMRRSADMPVPAEALDAGLCIHLFDRLIKECPGKKSKGDLTHFKGGSTSTSGGNATGDNNRKDTWWSVGVDCDYYSGYCPGGKNFVGW
ncbi:hypothetical protein AJ79_09360 [Helicocarpus griseus UAMH5409]|uniref:Ecp2 effector protein domain-containing protein n=1 Tax=Helicocarpus griseus UAMH5409 TaxID=1447875 RepID=A0A2B7WKB9_9EURO|nr:hypothetical protein AJ79_09360 [Helicocarpus griseus UAMH5409]